MASHWQSITSSICFRLLAPNKFSYINIASLINPRIFLLSDGPLLRGEFPAEASRNDGRLHGGSDGKGGSAGGWFRWTVGRESIESRLNYGRIKEGNFWDV